MNFQNFSSPFENRSSNPNNFLATFKEEKCKKVDIKKNIVFLKTHKCASSAVQSIFLRFGYSNDLKFVLPMKGKSF